LYSKFTDHFHTEGNLEKLVPRTPYFRAKMKSEVKINKIVNSVIFRLSAPVSRSINKDLVLAKMINSARTSGLISVYGKGTREQDFILTRDVSNAVIKILKNRSYGTFNLCSSTPVSMICLAESLAKYIGGVNIQIGTPEDPNEGQRARYDNSKLRDTVDWNPTTDVNEMLEFII
jgi:nucleoside-diphosphate-sugar epimerase